MRRLSKLDRSIDVFRPRTGGSLSSTLLCSSCRQHSPFSTALKRNARLDSKSWTESLRNKIWKDQPPGLEDPYNSSSAPIRGATARENLSVNEEGKGISAVAPAEVDMSTYEPATTWDGLVEVGEEPEEKFYFEGFLPDGIVTDPFEATAALHRAVVEVFTMANARAPLSEISNGSRTVDITAAVQISLPGLSSSPVLNYSSRGLVDRILQSFRLRDPEIRATETMDDSKEVEEIESKEAIYSATEDSHPVEEWPIDGPADSQSRDFQHQVASWDPVWLQISLENPETKFAIVKRILQLTGIRIPDARLRSIGTVRALLDLVKTPPKPKKLAEVLVQRNEIVTIPNVKIFDRRITPIDKEISVGRWKIIEKELERRGLPVTGH